MTLASITTAVDHWLRHFHGPVVYLLCALLVFAEAGFLLGFVVPGETAALAGGALAGLGHVDLVLMLVAVVAAAVVGDSVGYEVGRLLGPWLLRHRPLKDKEGVEKARHLVVRFGGPAVFVGRWVALARALVPGVAGMSGMAYRTFLPYNAVGGLVWGTTFVMIGYAAGQSYTTVASRIGAYALVVVGVVVVALVAVAVVRRRRRRRQPGPG